MAPLTSMAPGTGDAVDAVLALYRQVDVVALGECHWAKQDSDFRIRLIQDPRFLETVDTVVIEAGNALYQSVLDRYIGGDLCSEDELCRIWRDTTQPGAWDSPVYREFLSAVLEVNLKSPNTRRLRVLAGDPPMDWAAAEAGSDLKSILESRDKFAARLIEQEVIAKRKKALLIYGSAHFYRNHQSNILAHLNATETTRFAVIAPVGGPEADFASFDSSINLCSVPVFVPIRGTRFAGLNAANILEQGSKRIKIVDGKMVTVPVFETPVQLDQLVDACLYFGREYPT